MSRDRLAVVRRPTSITPLWVHAFAVLTTLATLFLLCLGGVVTSTNSGMTVPDWPTSYGYNMFLFPWSRMVGGIFYEHSHRLVASGVGFLTVMLAIFLTWQDSRKWMKTLGWVAVFSVSLQGVLGGLRVTLIKDEIGIFHACLAQAFFALVGFISLATSRWWLAQAATKRESQIPPGFKKLVILVTVIIFGQLILGATMRHEHAGLAVPDFPRAYGSWWPGIDQQRLEEINRERISSRAVPTTLTQIYVHMSHRIGAVLALAGIIGCTVCVWKYAGAALALRRLTATWTVLVLIQATLGACTIWYNKPADIATAHMAVGALIFIVGTLLAAITRRLEASGHSAVKERENSIHPGFVTA